MDGVLEQILVELKEIRLLLSAERENTDVADNGSMKKDTMTVKDAAEYLGITEFRLRTLTNQKAIRHFKAGKKFLYKRKSLDLWMEEVQAESVTR